MIRSYEITINDFKFTKWWFIEAEKTTQVNLPTLESRRSNSHQIEFVHKIEDFELCLKDFQWRILKSENDDSILTYDSSAQHHNSSQPFLFINKFKKYFSKDLNKWWLDSWVQKCQL